MAVKEYKPTSAGRRHMSGSSFEEITKDKPEMTIKMLETFIERSGEEIGEMLIHIQDRNWDLVRRVAHKMKPALAYLGMKDLEKRISEIHREVKTSSFDIQKIEKQALLINKILKESYIKLDEEIQILKQQITD